MSSLGYAILILIGANEFLTHTWQWGLDALGNWREYKYDEGDGQTWKLEQTRAHNKVNEIHTSDDHSTSPDVDAIKEGQGQTAWAAPTYNAAGNWGFQ